MAVKTPFTPDDFVHILSHYHLGTYVHSAALSQGAIQTNYFLQTSQGRFVFRYYESRSPESVLFESGLLAYLTARHYPCPPQLPNGQGSYVGLYRHKPYILFDFIDGQTIEQPTRRQWWQLVQKAAELHTLTQGYDSPYTSYRWNYSPELCQELAQTAAERINTPTAHAKHDWLVHQLATLDLPPALPKGVCHCDFHFYNMLFVGDQLAAVLDFDDANLTFLTFDLVGLMEAWACPYPCELLDLPRARLVLQEYNHHRPLSALEQYHLYDVYQLSILFDCVWYFGRGSAEDFYEKRKIDALNRLGRDAFADALFDAERRTAG
jgi:homoserine kinase type II